MIFLDALHGKNSARPPVWFMRQAGRYLPEYRAFRSKYSFLEMARTPELITEVTLLPIRLLGFDAAILFSDILVILDAFKINFHFEEQKGPVIEQPAQLDQISCGHVEDSLSYVQKAIKMLKKELNIPLIGFCGAPFTVASYLIEGGSSKDLKKTKKMMLHEPELFHALLKKIADCSIAYLNMQIRAGVSAIQIFDSWAGFLSHAHFKEFTIKYLKYILESIISIPSILFCKGSSVYATQLATINPSAISLDIYGNLPEIRKQLPSNIALQGNLDPDILYAPTHVVRKETKRLLDSMKNDPSYIFNLGHGIHPDTPLESVRTVLECVKSQ